MHDDTSLTAGPAAGPARPPERALLIANRSARRADELQDHAVDLLTRAGVAVRVATPADPDAMTRQIAGADDEFDAVLVLGGDGTLNAAAPGLLESGLPLGLLPGGTANDLARTLGISPDLDEAIACILRGQTRAIDLGEVNGRPYFNVASFGLSVALANELTRESKKRWGVFAYVLAALRAMATARPFHAEIDARRADGSRTHVRVKSWQVAVGNGVYYGGGMAVRDGATIDDATLELYSLEMENLWKLLPMLLHFRTGQHGLWREVRTLRAVEIDIRTRKARAVNADGEIVGRTPVRMRVLPAALRVYAPSAR